eukprot:TRINITY_DN6297_c0_g1_i4.p1 TRINITY_DN6297_c0_g1~~TRINITY_DN6297_c0_g1_i4.p1  ORF type:complete len:108 (+),score=7.33 TRINITY_DN6297_c0_g1_i4:1306-1629(+)
MKLISSQARTSRDSDWTWMTQKLKSTRPAQVASPLLIILFDSFDAISYPSKNTTLTEPLLAPKGQAQSSNCEHQSHYFGWMENWQLKIGGYDLLPLPLSNLVPQSMD